MDTEIVIIGLFGLISMAIDALLWGLMGYVIFKVLRFQDQKWLIGALVTATIYFAWDELIMTNMVGMMGVQFNNDEFSEFMGDDWMTFDITDLLFAYGGVIAGFRVAIGLIKLLLKRVPPEIPESTARDLLTNMDDDQIH